MIELVPALTLPVADEPVIEPGFVDIARVTSGPHSLQLSVRSAGNVGLSDGLVLTPTSPPTDAPFPPTTVAPDDELLIGPPLAPTRPPAVPPFPVVTVTVAATDELSIVPVGNVPGQLGGVTPAGITKVVFTP